MRAVTIERGFSRAGLLDAARGIAAGRQAIALARAATTLYEAGGREILTAGTQNAIRNAAEAAAGNALGAGTTSLLKSGAKEIARTAGRVAARSASREILKGAGKAAGLGFAIDGAIATFEAVREVRAGTMTRPKAFQHVGKEAVSGALATAAGTLACVGLVAITGPLSIPAMVVCGAGASLGAKTLLRRIMNRPAPIAVT